MKLIRTLFVAAVASTLAISAQAAKPEPQSTGTVDVKTGQTAIRLDSTFAGALQAGEIAVAKIIPGKVVTGKGELRFPITGGAIDLETLNTEISHSGGVNFSKGEVSVSIVDLVISIPAEGSEASAVVTGIVVVDGSSLGRVELFGIDATLTAPLEVPNNKKIVVKDVDLTLTQTGADALNAAFEVDVFTSSTVVGSATVSATVVKGSL